MCRIMSKALSKSSTPNNYKSLYDGVRKYLFNETGHNIDQGSSFMKHQGNQFLDNDSGSNKCRNIFYQRADVSLYKSVDIGKKAYHCSEHSKVCNQSCKLIQQQSIENVEKHYKSNTCGNKTTHVQINATGQRILFPVLDIYLHTSTHVPGTWQLLCMAKSACLRQDGGSVPLLKCLGLNQHLKQQNTKKL